MCTARCATSRTAEVLAIGLSSTRTVKKVTETCLYYACSSLAYNIAKTSLIVAVL